MIICLLSEMIFSSDKRHMFLVLQIDYMKLILFPNNIINAIIKKRSAMKEKILKIVTVLFVFIFAISMKGVITKAEDARFFCYTQKKQAKTNWCWAASAENSVRWERSITRDQYDAVKKIKGIVIINPYPNVGGSIADIKKAAEYISKNKESYSKTALSTSSGVKSFEFLKNEVKNSDVTILVGGYYDSKGKRNGGHVVTCTGYSISGNSNVLTIYDPWDGSTSNVKYSYFKDGFGSRKYDGTVYNAE